MSDLRTILQRQYTKAGDLTEDEYTGTMSDFELFELSKPQRLAAPL